ncbi:Uncharacterised protein [Weissella viridescens]|uniref:Uncharacterized protein n=1 Tax=Weissella viridescens TaxID=1629 RepID=A0A380P849_WEIVI|nr:Uncharacterised protein [Weissella viridescens]
MTEKLILRAENKKDKEYNPVFISSDTHQKLKQLSKSTGIPMRSLADKMFNLRLKIQQLSIQMMEVIRNRRISNDIKKTIYA